MLKERHNYRDITMTSTVTEGFKLGGKWSDYCDDVCPFCHQHMDVWAWTYAFNNTFTQCQHCKKVVQSGNANIDGKGWFVWLKPAVRWKENE